MKYSDFALWSRQNHLIIEQTVQTVRDDIINQCQICWNNIIGVRFKAKLSNASISSQSLWLEVIISADKKANSIDDQCHSNY